MRQSALHASIVLLVSLIGATRANCEFLLQCNPPALGNQDTGLSVEPRSADENSRIRQAPHGAARRGKHTLLVHWAGGVQTFTDKPPYDEPLDGVAWTYCGYSPTTGFHLIGYRNIDKFTGKLVNEKTGELIPGGHAVAFSPNLEQYIAYEQPDGQDGETMYLFSRKGVLLWKGFSGLLSRDRKAVLADFDDVHWDLSGKLTAEFRDPNGKKQTLKLVDEKDGHLEWQPQNR